MPEICKQRPIPAHLARYCSDIIISEKQAERERQKRAAEAQAAAEGKPSGWSAQMWQTYKAEESREAERIASARQEAAEQARRFQEIEIGKELRDKLQKLVAGGNFQAAFAAVAAADLSEEQKQYWYDYIQWRDPDRVKKANGEYTVIPSPSDLPKAGIMAALQQSGIAPGQKLTLNTQECAQLKGLAIRYLENIGADDLQMEQLENKLSTKVVTTAMGAGYVPLYQFLAEHGITCITPKEPEIVAQRALDEVLRVYGYQLLSAGMIVKKERKDAKALDDQTYDNIIMNAMERVKREWDGLAPSLRKREVAGDAEWFDMLNKLMEKIMLFRSSIPEKHVFMPHDAASAKRALIAVIRPKLTEWNIPPGPGYLRPQIYDQAVGTYVSPAVLYIAGGHFSMTVYRAWVALARMGKQQIMAADDATILRESEGKVPTGKWGTRLIRKGGTFVREKSRDFILLEKSLDPTMKDLGYQRGKADQASLFLPLGVKEVSDEGQRQLTILVVDYIMSQYGAPAKLPQAQYISDENFKVLAAYAVNLANWVRQSFPDFARVQTPSQDEMAVAFKERNIFPQSDMPQIAPPIPKVAPRVLPAPTQPQPTTPAPAPAVSPAPPEHTDPMLNEAVDEHLTKQHLSLYTTQPIELANFNQLATAIRLTANAKGRNYRPRVTFTQRDSQAALIARGYLQKTIYLRR